MGMDATQLNHFLVDKGIIRWRGGRYHMTPEYANRGLDKVREHHAYSLNGRRKVKPYLVWTEMGLDFIRKLIN
jgi:phage antirepressor YoqD-like protein